MISYTIYLIDFTFSKSWLVLQVLLNLLNTFVLFCFCVSSKLLGLTFWGTSDVNVSHLTNVFCDAAQRVVTPFSPTWRHQFSPDRTQWDSSQFDDFVFVVNSKHILYFFEPFGFDLKLNDNVTSSPWKHGSLPLPAPATGSQPPFRCSWKLATRRVKCSHLSYKTPNIH